LGIQGTLKFSLQNNSSLSTLGKILIKGLDVDVTSILEISVLSIVFSLLSNVSVFQVTQG